MRDRLLLLDGASLWFRAFYAVPASVTNDAGMPVNAVRGFIDMVASLINTHRPDRLVVCLDLDWRPQFRVDLIPSYKAHRVAEDADDSNAEEVPDDLTPQVAVIEDILAAAGIATGGAVGLEADDVLGTLSTIEQQAEVIVVSGDRDLLQLVRNEPNPVRVLYVGRGLAKAELLDPALVSEKYGVPAANAGDAYADLATLRGDSSDGLPGVAGIGEKTASTLMLKWHTLDALRHAARDPGSDVAQGIRGKLAAAGDYLNVAPTVVRVVRDAVVELSKDDVLPTTPPAPEELARLAAEFNAQSPIDRLVAALQAR